MWWMIWKVTDVTAHFMRSVRKPLDLVSKVERQFPLPAKGELQEVWVEMSLDTATAAYGGMPTATVKSFKRNQMYLNPYIFE